MRPCEDSEAVSQPPTLADRSALVALSGGYRSFCDNAAGKAEAGEMRFLLSSAEESGPRSGAIQSPTDAARGVTSVAVRQRFGSDLTARGAANGWRFGSGGVMPGGRQGGSDGQLVAQSW